MKSAIVRILFCLCVSCGSVLAQTIPLNTLGELQLDYQDVVAKDGVVRHGDYSATYLPMPGAGMQLVAPMQPQRVHYLVTDGEWVEKGHRVAVLEGSEVHHFKDSLAAKKALFEIAATRYQRNKALYDKQAISRETWLDVSNAYFEMKLEWGHLDHFAELFESDQDDDRGFLIAPESGYFLRANKNTGPDSAVLGEIVPQATLRIHLAVTVGQADSISAISVKGCQLTVDKRDNTVSRRMVSLWSAPLKPVCAGRIGEQVNVKLVETNSVQLIPPQSVFYMQGNPQVLVKTENALEAVAINIVGQSESGLLLISENNALKDKAVLMTSVSAVQGILLGLGGVE